MTDHYIDDRVVEEIKIRVKPSDVIGRTVKLKRVGQEFVGLSPFNTEKTPSFTVNDEKGFYHCFSSGKHGDVIDFLQQTQGISFRDAVNSLAAETGTLTVHESEKPKPRATVVCHYDYLDRDGEPYLRVTRKSDKSFAQSHWDLDSWKTGKPSGPVIPYRLPEILASPAATVHLVEGEKSADYLASLGLIATTAPGGGSAFPLTDDFAVWFDGQSVRAYPDNDATGRKWAERVAQRLPHAEIVWLPDQPEKAGADDWLKTRTVDDLVAVKSGSDVSEPETPEPRRVTPTPYSWTDPATIPRRDWLYGRHLIRRYVSTTISPGGLGKSSMVLVEALAMVSGQSLIGEGIHQKEPLRVWYWNGEDPNDESTRRIQAAAIHHNLRPDDIGDRLFVDSGREMRIRLAQMIRGAVEIDETLFEEIEAGLIARNIDVWQLDPFISTHQVSENDNGAIDAIVKRLGIVAERAKVAIELVHHVRKPGGGNTAQTDVNDARGASALIGGVRSARVLNVMGEDIADLVGIEHSERYSYFSVTNGKSNLAPRSDKGQWRRIVSVELGNDGPTQGTGDHVGVVTEYKMPDQMSAIPPNAVDIAQDVASRHPEARYDKRSGDWFGHLVGPALGVSSMDKGGASTLAKIIDTWIKSGVLIKRMAQDQNRKMREFIAAPESAPVSQSVSDYDPLDPDDCPF